MYKVQKQMEKILGEPFAMEFSNYVRKLRSNLIITSVIFISLLLGWFEITAESIFLGLKPIDSTNQHFLKLIFFLNAYMFLHFLWCAIDYFQEWWLRLTGTRVAYVTTGKSAYVGGDYPDDPRQSTLYNWWRNEARLIASLQKPLEEIDEKLINWEVKVKKSLKGKDPNVIHACMSINQVSTDVNKLMNSIKKSSESLESHRIPASLKRFDSHFQFYLRSQNLRWLIMELGFPLILGGYALLLALSLLWEMP